MGVVAGEWLKSPKLDLLRKEEQFLEREGLPGSGDAPELAPKTGSLARCTWWSGV